jgi:hypothetical protein
MLYIHNEYIYNESGYHFITNQRNLALFVLGLYLLRFFFTKEISYIITGCSFNCLSFETIIRFLLF